MLATRRQRFKMISVRNLLHRVVPVSLVVFVLLLMLPSSVSPFGFDSANSCNPNGGAAKQSRRGRAQMMAAIPCDLTQQVYCHLPGAAYPWHAVRRFVHENQGLMKRMYGDVKHISVLRDELLGNEIDNADVAMAAERYSREGNRRSAKFLKNRRPGDEEYMGAGRPTNEAPHFRPVTTTTTRASTTTTTEAAPTGSLEKNESSFERNEPGNESLNEPANESQNEHENEPANESQNEHENEPANEFESEPKNESWKGPINSTLVETQSAREPEQDVEDLAANSVYEIIPPLGDGLAAHLSGDNIQIIASPQLPVGGVNATTTTTTATTTKKVEPSPANLTFTTTSSRTTPTTTTPSSTPTEPTNSSMHTTTESPSSSSSAAAPATSSPASPFRRRQRPAMSYKQHHNLLQQQHQQHYQQQQQQQSQMLHLKISSSMLRDSPSTRIKLNESERIAVKGGGGVASASLSPPGSTAATSTTTTTATSSSSISTTTTTTQLTMNKRKPIKPIEAAAVAATAPTAFKGDHRFRKPAPTQSATPSAATAGTTGGTTTTRPVLKEGQLFQDTMKQEVVAAPAIPVTNMRGVNACPVKEEVVAPFWANNTRGEVLALLNLYPFEQYVHWEKCTHEHKQMYCRDGCRCEQQYRLHRLLAYDPHNECRGIFSDWFRFPSCCICKCYNIPMEFRATSRSPRSDQSGLYDSHQEAAEVPPPRHPIETAEAEVKRAIYEHATEDWYRRRDDWHDDAEEGVEADPIGEDGGDEFGELF